MYSLSHCVDSGRNLSIGCTLAWVAITRDSESEYPFYPVGQFRRICAGPLFPPFLIGGEILWQLFFWITLEFCAEGCDWTNVGHPVCLIKSIVIDSNLPVTWWHSSLFIVVLTDPTTNNFNSIWFDHDTQHLKGEIDLNPSAISVRLSPSIMREHIYRIVQMLSRLWRRIF